MENSKSVGQQIFSKMTNENYNSLSPSGGNFSNMNKKLLKYYSLWTSDANFSNSTDAKWALFTSIYLWRYSLNNKSNLKNILNHVCLYLTDTMENMNINSYSQIEQNRPVTKTINKFNKKYIY